VRALLRKELRALLPQWVLMVVFMSSDVLSRPFTERLDELTWVRISMGLSGQHDGLAVTVLTAMAFVVGYSAFPREHDEGTIEFLYGLPLGRGAIFAAKVLAGAAVLASAIALGEVTNALLASFNHQTYAGQQFAWGPMLGSRAVLTAFTLFMYCHGLLASYLRRFGLLPYAIALAAAHTVAEHAPSLAWVDPTRLCTLEWRGRELLVPWRGLGAQAVVAALAFAAAWALWTADGERSRAFFAKLRGGGALGLRVTAPLGCATALVVVAVAGAMWAVGGGSDPARPDAGVAETARVETGRMTFTYPVARRARARALIASGEGVYAAVRSLHGDAAGAGVVVDLTEVSADHEGITAWTTVRVGVGGDESASGLRHVLAHELTHAVQMRLSDMRAGERREAHFFVEGGAEWSAFEVEPDAERRRRSRVVAAASWSRLRLDFAQVADPARYARRGDETLSYSLGETFVAALAGACGRDAPGRVLRAMNGADRLNRLDPVPYWQDVTQSAGCELERVLGAWDDLLAEVSRVEGDAIAAIPRAAGGVSRATDDAVDFAATLDRDAPDGARVLIELRERAGAPATETIQVEGRVDDADRRLVRFTVARARLRGRRAEFHFGVQPWRDGWAVYEAWQSTTLP
jgi:hypothetical protein